ncbi:Hsp33 family molecular chaperone HslO [Staphylospora marina]|uniref:Hsp33 family molecular chaperone HslO n=1 Tax=Staphylospora marina TaxID=2490858 RepID=UPI000F5BC807|nr:Hsp33 family molecular chaperone HslO [Staphylospora marina]
MRDYTVRAISADGFVRGFAAKTTGLVQDMCNRQKTWPVASAALGRTVTMAAMMGLNLKEEKHRITIRVSGDGPLGQIIADADGQGNVRGTVDHPQTDIPRRADGKLDVGTAVGKGSIYIIKDLGLREPYTGTSPIVSGELGDDFTYYFSVSEQTPSSVGLGVLVKGEEILAAGGYMVQVMPGASDEVIDRLEQRIAGIGSISERIQEGATPEDLMYLVLGDDAEILESRPVRFRCRCSRERIEAMLRSLGKDEVESLLNEQGKAEVVCHFCGETRTFGEDELKRIIEEII